jgi:hypothetical protein
MIMSFFDELQKEDGIQRDTVTAWGQTFKLRSLNGDEMIDHAEDDIAPITKRASGVRLLVATIELEDGTRIPREDRPKYVELLLKKDFRALKEVTQKARALNGLSITKDAIKNG